MFGQHLCAWSRERTLPTLNFLPLWILLAPSPCPSLLSAWLHFHGDYSTQDCSQEQWFTKRGPILCTGGFTNPLSLAWLASFLMACPLETLLATTATIWFVSWDIERGCILGDCCVARNWVSFLGCFVVLVALTEPACTIPVWLRAGAGRSWGHGWFASLWACRSSITSSECGDRDEESQSRQFSLIYTWFRTEHVSWIYWTAFRPQICHTVCSAGTVRTE